MVKKEKMMIELNTRVDMLSEETVMQKYELERKKEEIMRLKD